MQRKNLRDDEEGVTSVLGEMLAVSIVVGLVAAAGAAAIQAIDAPDSMTETQLRATLDCGTGIWYDGDERIIIYHRGGPAIDSARVDLKLTVNGRESQSSLGDRLASKPLLDGGGVHGDAEIGTVGAQAAAAAAAAAAQEAAQAAAAAAADAQAALDAILSGGGAVTNATIGANLATVAAANLTAAAVTLDAVAAKDAAKDAKSAWKDYLDDAGVAYAADPFVAAAHAVAASSDQAVKDAEKLLDDKSPFLATQLAVLAAEGNQFALDAAALKLAITTAIAGGSDAVAAQAAADAAADAAALAQEEAAAATAVADALGPFRAPMFEVGSAWISDSQRIKASDRVEYVLIDRSGTGDSAVLADGVLTERICGGQSSIQGLLTEVFGVLPFVDRDCDGDLEVGDELLELSDFDDGHFILPGTEGCLVLPKGTPDIVAETIHLRAPDGVYIEVDLTTTSGDMTLDGGNGPVEAIGVELTSAEGMSIQGSSVDVSGSTLLIPSGQFGITSNGNDISAVGSTIVVGEEGGSSEPEPIIDLPDQAGSGSVRFCIALLDANNRVTNGWMWGGQEFRVSGRDGVPSMPAPEGILPEISTTAPITLNADLFYDDGIKDGYCVTFNDLELGGWFYSQGTVGNPAGWEVSLHNDQNTDAIVTVDDFFHYSPELFDADPTNDGERDSNSDGHIVLNSGRPFRSMVTLFRNVDVLDAEVAIDSNGGNIDLSNASFVAHDADVGIESDGGAIVMNGFSSAANNALGQVRIQSFDGDIQAFDAAFTAPEGQVRILAGDGVLALDRSTAQGRYGVDLGGSDIRLVDSVLSSLDDHVDVFAWGPGIVPIDQQGADIQDRDIFGSALPDLDSPGVPEIRGIAAVGGLL